MVRKPPARHFVGGAIVRGARREESLRGALEHDAHAGVDLAQRAEIALAHEPRVGVRQETGLLDDRAARRAQILEGGAMPARLEPVAVLGEDGFRAIAEREERLFDSELFAASQSATTSSISIVRAPGSPGSRRKVQ